MAACKQNQELKSKASLFSFFLSSAGEKQSSEKCKQNYFFMTCSVDGEGVK